MPPPPPNPPPSRGRAIAELADFELASKAWDRLAHEGQRAPDGDWRTWVFLGGRGAGKTRAGAEWVWDVAARLGAGGRIALVAPTLNDARTVMIEGPSGLLNLPYRSGATWEPSKRRVRFPGGAVGLVFSAEEPQRLRGPQFHAAWGDEVCAWFRSEETLAMLRLGMRLGTGPQLLLTTTPRPGRLMRGVLAEAGCVRTHAGTRANVENLAPGFLEAMQDLYGGTRRAAQELEGKLLEADGALFRLEDVERAKALGLAYRPKGWLRPEGYLDVEGFGPVERVVVAVDPPAGTLSGRPRDACGIVVAGAVGNRLVVLEDRTAAGLSPEGWAARVKRAVQDWPGSKVVLETNQGGAMGEAVLRACGLTGPVKRVHATAGKVARAEPVAALYEQGKVAHLAGLEPLEDELLGLGADDAGGRSPDRADALVWALTELMIPRGAGPRIRVL